MHKLLLPIEIFVLGLKYLLTMITVYIAYLLIIVPAALILKYLFCYDVLGITLDDTKSTYWETPKAIRSYRSQL